jgi:starvation-inducible DNA-binding protein
MCAGDTKVQWLLKHTYVLISGIRISKIFRCKEIDMTTAKHDQEVIHQVFSSLREVRVGLRAQVRHQSVQALNRLLAHSMALRDLYKKAHWQTSGQTFYALHLMFDKHYETQLELIDALAERVQTLGGVALATAHDLVQESQIARVPSAAEPPTQQLTRLLDGHEFLLNEARPFARGAAESGDDGTNDLIVGSIIRTNELQAWFVGEHLDLDKQEAK